MKLSKAFVDEIEYQGQGKSAQVHFDSRVPGFGIRVYPSGAKSYVLKYRAKGKQRFFVIGRHGPLTLAQAVKLAAQKYNDIKAGQDPQLTRDAERLGATLQEFSKTYMKKHAKPHKKSWKRDQELLDIYILPKLGSKRLLDIKRPDIARLHSNIGEAQPITANRCLSLLSKMFNLASVWGAIPEETANPATRITRFAENKRERHVDYLEEFPALAEAINQEGIFFKAFFWLSLLTGLRKSQLRTLKWDTVRLQSQHLNLVDQKTGKPLRVHLSPPAVIILKAIPRINENPYVFCGNKNNQPLVNVNKAWARIKERAEIDPETNNLWIHDLRRTLASWMAQEGKSLYLIGQILGHSSTETTKRYAHLVGDNRRDALEEHSKKMEGVIDIGGF